jgi:hypothetical protein
MLTEAVPPPEIMRSAYGPEPCRRAAELPGIMSLPVRDLFPDIRREISSLGNDLSAIRRATREALASVNMDMIATHDTVNILCSEHGFGILGGHPYAEMLRTIKDVVSERTGCGNIRLRVAVWAGFKEADEFIRHYRLDQDFNGQAVGIGPFDKGVPIETEIGTLYGIARAYDADWFIHAHYDDPREVYLHRLIDRPIKPFGMSYARLETRTVYHMSFGNRSGNFIPKAIFNSSFIQQKFAFTCYVMTSPEGIIGIDADNDLTRLGRRLTVNTLKSYGKLLRLFAEIEECIAVVDGARWIYYIHAAGLTFGNLLYARSDHLDLEADLSPFTVERILGSINTSIKSLVINQMWVGLTCMDAPLYIPTIIANRGMADTLLTDSSNPEFMNMAVTAESLEAAVGFARRIAGTENIIIFDGAFGSINLSPSMAEFLLQRAPGVSRKVDEDLLPNWLRQRGMDPGSCV